MRFSTTKNSFYMTFNITVFSCIHLFVSVFLVSIFLTRKFVTFLLNNFDLNVRIIPVEEDVNLTFILGSLSLNIRIGFRGRVNNDPAIAGERINRVIMLIDNRVRELRSVKISKEMSMAFLNMVYVVAGVFILMLIINIRKLYKLTR